VLRVILKYAHGGQSVIRELKRVSTPGLRQYVGVTEIPRVRNGLGMAILSTSKGLMSDRAGASGATPAASCSPWSGKETRTCRVSASARSRFRPG
jgi:hypothetical protein